MARTTCVGQLRLGSTRRAGAEHALAPIRVEARDGQATTVALDLRR
jgi:hypothetical protein